MAMDTCRIPPEWKQPVMTFRDAVTAEQGQEVVEAIAALAAAETGQELLAKLPLLVEALEQNPRSTLDAIAAVAEGETLPTPASGGSTALLSPTIQGHAIPSALAAGVNELLELNEHNPQEARRILAEALAARVKPTTPDRPKGSIRIVLQNEHTDKETFAIRGGLCEFPTNSPVDVYPADLEAIEQQLASRRIDRFSPAPRSEVVRC